MSPIAPGVTVEDRFVIEKMAGSGGMGRVFRAHDVVGERPVAVKILTDHGEDEVERFRREAEFLAQSRHPALARYIAHGTWEDTPYLVQEWIDGITLSRFLATVGCTVRESVELVSTVARALAVLHGHGIVHRDIKPGNIILEGDDITHPKLVDLGVARRIDHAIGHSLTRTGSFLGTPGYTAPEQVQGKKEVGPPADLFALGVILYECLTGTAAFAGINGLARNTKVLLLDPMPVSGHCQEAPPELVALVGRLLEKDPAQRVQAVEELLAALPDPAQLPDEQRRPVGWHENVATARPDLLGRRRPQMALRVPSEDRVACMILAVPAPGTTMEWREDHPPNAPFASIADAHGLRVKLHEDGSISALLSGVDPESVVERAAICALALAREMTGSPIVLVSQTLDGAAAHLDADPLEWAFEVLEMWAVRIAMTAESAEINVRIDEATAGLLPARFRVQRSDDAIHLLDELAA